MQLPATRHMKPAPPDILFRDDHYVAVHKPPGLLVLRTWLARDEHFLLQLVRDRIGQRVYPVHRLDRATSGVIIFGLSPEATRLLQAEFEGNRVVKHYRAVVRGWLSGPGIIDHPLADEETGMDRRPAQTRYRPLAFAELDHAVDRYATARYTLVEAEPVTGRRHQIRKHFKHVSHPIVGDTTYGKGTHNRFFRTRFGADRLLLMAWHLAFEHPFDRRPLGIPAIPEAGWMELMEALGWDGV